MGNFLGPTLGGFLVQAWGFRWATLLYWCCYLLAIIIDCFELIYNVRNQFTTKNLAYERLE